MNAPTPRRLSVVVPVYNEIATIREAIAALRAASLPAGLEREIIAVDDGSTDGSAQALLELAEASGESGDLVVVRLPRNMGKGAALRAGLERSIGDIVLIHDADLEYDPRDHAEALGPILSGRADAVIGTRFRGGPAQRTLYFWHSVANHLLTLFSNAVTNLNLTDIECCLKVFTREVASRLDLRERGFGVEPEIVAKLARMRLDNGPRGWRRLRIYEVAVSYSGRTYAEGKKIRWTDGLWAVWCVLRYGLGPIGRPSWAGAHEERV